LFTKEEKHQALAHPLCSREWSIRPQKTPKMCPYVPQKGGRYGQNWKRLKYNIIAFG